MAGGGRTNQQGGGVLGQQANQQGRGGGPKINPAEGQANQQGGGGGGRGWQKVKQISKEGGGGGGGVRTTSKSPGGGEVLFPKVLINCEY